MTDDLLYADGGVVGRNPSSLGGTWAWVLVRGGEVVRQASGAVTPGDVDVTAVTNNQSELLAAVRALEAMPPGWAGVLRTDSKVTLHRLTHSEKFNGVPQWLRLRALAVRRGRRWRVELVGGHPTRAELAAGRLRKNGLPCCRWNVLVDALCGAAARALARNP